MSAYKPTQITGPDGRLMPGAWIYSCDEDDGNGPCAYWNYDGVSDSWFFGDTEQAAIDAAQAAFLQWYQQESAQTADLLKARYGTEKPTSIRDYWQLPPVYEVGWRYGFWRWKHD